MSATDGDERGRLGRLEPIEPPTGWRALSKIGLPVAGVLAGVAVLLLALEPELRRNVFTFIAIYLVPGGIDAGPLAGVSLLGLDPLWVIALVTYFDLWLTMFWVWNIDHLVRFGWVERRVEKTRERAHSLWKRFPWLRVASGPGLALFITIPIPTTGSFSGIAIGKLIDLPDPVTYMASVGGTMIRVAALAFGTEGILWFF
ncbi:hypothetical protein BRD56_11650 [Thermoplasmatales archaeon SW_10_69_26]|nr:MAG: hypothetical protein BRD56_11650 [Thermoplasmatales archaeon SW_10_69_26]